MSSAALLDLLVSLVYGEGAETVFEKEAAQHSRRGSVAQQAEPWAHTPTYAGSTPAAHSTNSHVCVAQR